MELWIYDNSGAETALPGILSWEFCHGFGQPCDSFELKFLWEKDMAGTLERACGVKAVHEGRVVFKGRIDEYCLKADANGGLGEMSGRGMQALLLDNEAESADYYSADLPYILSRHVQALGINEIDTSGAAGSAPLFTVESGASHWGVVEEDDDSLRGRVLASYRRLPNGANAAWYETLALDTEGVEKVVVLPRERGRGTVDIVFSAAGGVPGDELIQQVQQTLDKHREICVDVLVRTPQVKTVNIVASVKAAQGYSFDSVSAHVESALREYFGGHRLGEGVYKAKLLALIMGIEGVENCSLSSPAADIAADKIGLPVVGTISISEVK